MSIALPLLALVFAASAFPWLLVLRARFGHLLAVPATAGGALLLLLVVLLLSRALHAGYIATLVAASIIVGVIGGILAARTPGVFRRPGRYAVALWCPALAGAVVWALTAILAQLIPGASRFGWVMNGDALNNLWYAGVIQHSNGLAIGATQNPVPLPAALISVALGTGAPTSASAATLLTHELAALLVTWVVLLAATCISMGVVVASAVDGRRTGTVALASALGSLLPLTWFVSGLTVQWGYFNLSVLLPTLLAGWLVFLTSTRHPVVAFICLTGLATLTLATWTPAVVLPGALALVLLVRNRAAFRGLARSHAIATFLGVAQVVVWIGIVTIPTYLAQGSALEIPGVGFPPTWWGLLVLAALLVCALLLLRGHTSLPITSGATAILVAGAIASAALLYLASDQPDVFGAYYPKKLAWILLVLTGTIALSFAIAIVAERVRTLPRAIIAVVMCLVLLAAAALPIGGWPETLERQPTARILGDHVRHDGEQDVTDILALTNARHPNILWQSGNPDEPVINEYLLVANGGFVRGDRALMTLVASQYFIYRATGRYSDADVSTLCAMIRRVQPMPTVRTASPTLAAQLHATCPTAKATVRIDTSLRGPRPATTGLTWQVDGIE
jgi:hypothetical protein